MFDCGPLGEDEARIQVDGQELDGWAWVDAARLDDYLSPRLARRVRSVLDGPSDAAAYLEHGTPFSGVDAP